MMQLQTFENPKTDLSNIDVEQSMPYIIIYFQLFSKQNNDICWGS